MTGADLEHMANATIIGDSNHPVNLHRTQGGQWHAERAVHARNPGVCCASAMVAPTESEAPSGGAIRPRPMVVRIGVNRSMPGHEAHPDSSWYFALKGMKQRPG
jgi:hypothetical protein